MDFDIPIGKNGDCYDRYHIRVEEMRAAIQLKQRAMDGRMFPLTPEGLDGAMKALMR